MLKPHNSYQWVTGFINRLYKIEGQSGLIYCSVEMFAFANIFLCLSRQSFQHPTFNMLEYKDEFCWLCFCGYANALKLLGTMKRVFTQLGGFVRVDYENMSPLDAPVSLEHDKLILF